MFNSSKKAYESMSKKFQANYCLYPAKYRYHPSQENQYLSFPYTWLNITINETQLVSTYNHYIIEMSKIFDIIKYSLVFMFVVILFYAIVPNKSPLVEQRSKKELEIRRYATHEEFIIHDDELKYIQ
ncbi:uncharacterized protein LOC113232258 [Hyposmocoma kahamanoa]|uniref:uncharacterized protein LOC113232258 n=1 Tax=Hyposmocoma kahamanoa TaxID=1477025 RepID=UPI000E6D9C18|nr:uncharacterized protein LOC113232258 [Hyposmocoma kahamanoa]